jgi:hypothetical protein
MFAAIVDLYRYDSLRGDGYGVRFARLNMIDTHVTLVFVLCWVMEMAFDVAYLSRNSVRYASIITFWLAWGMVLTQVHAL